MNIRDLIPELILIVLMMISGIITVSRLWQDVVIAVTVLVLLLALGGLFLYLIIRIRKLGEEQRACDKQMRAVLEDLGRQLVAKQDKTTQTVIETVESLKTRMYR